MTDAMGELQELADFVAAVDFDGLPPDVVDRIHWIVRDTVGVIVGGMREPEIVRLANWATATHPGDVLLFGHGGRVRPEWAAFVHAAAGNTLEMDEGHAYAAGHAAIHTVPTALALGAATDASGIKTIAAMVAGYEAAARVGVATTLRRPVHPFGTWGVLGAAVIGGRFLGYDGDQMRGVMELAAAYAINPSFAAALQGANGRNTYAGLVNQTGLLAADLYALGFRGERAGVSTTFGHILGECFDAEALVEGLGERFELMRGYFKPYSACRYTHAAVDAALALRHEQDFDPDAIERIFVDTYDFASRLADPRPRTALAGRFSIPYVVAAVLITGSAGPEIFAAHMLQNPELLSLAAIVEVAEDPALTAMTPSRRPARLRIRLRNGVAYETLVTLTRGDPALPMSPEELRTKFSSLVMPVLGSARSDTLWHMLGNVAGLADIRMLEPFLDPD